MKILFNRIYREKLILDKMVKLYCKNSHGIRIKICHDCLLFLKYAEVRLDKCTFNYRKPVCNKCKIHCFKPGMGDRARKIMRYSGPKMLKNHPVLAMLHLFDYLYTILIFFKRK